MPDLRRRQPDESEADFHERAAELQDEYAKHARAKNDLAMAARVEERAKSARLRAKEARVEAEQGSAAAKAQEPPVGEQN